jgi:two-component system sensor histidine kinase BaeS
MAAIALRAGDGDLEVRVPERRRDEVGQVAHAFNRMADRRQELEEARRRMVSDVSHELRTPLANVRGWVEAAQDGVVAADQQLLSSLHEESLHLQALVDDLHDLSLGDAGELRLDPQPIELQEFLDQVATSFRATAGAPLEVSVEPGARIEADPLRLRQAVGNLVANALRHTPPGGRVTLRGAPGTIVVADTGEGIPADELPFVFDRFRRVDPSRSRATGGSGLGLAIVRQIAESHGGTATVRSTVGEGTEVTLTVPAATASVASSRR